MLLATAALPALQAGIGMANKYAQYQSQKEEVAWANKQSDLAYQRDVSGWQYRNQLAIDKANQFDQLQKLKRAQFNEQRVEYGKAYSDYLFSAQAKLNEQQENYMGKALDAQVRLMEANAANAARGRQGKRAGMASRANSLRAGMDLNKMQEQMDTTSYYTNLQMQQQARRTNQDIMNAYYRSGIGQTRAPVRFGPAPVHAGYRNDPSPFGMLLGMAGDAMDFVGNYNSMIPETDKGNRIFGGFGTRYAS